MSTICIFGSWDLNNIIDYSDEIDYLNDSLFVYGSIKKPIINKEEKYKTYPYKPNIKYILYERFKEIKKELNIRVLNICSDHILDLQKKGLLDTIANLKKEDITAIGAGLSLQKMDNYASITYNNNIKCTIICGSFNPKIWGVKNNSYGINYIDKDNPMMFISSILNIMKMNISNITIVSINYKKRYVKEFSNLSEKLILLGVDIVVGVSDYIGGIKQIENNYIFYSLGDMGKDHIILKINIKNKNIEIKKIKIEKNKSNLKN